MSQPRLSTDLEPSPTAFAVWWRAARPFSLTAAAVPMVVGAALAAYHGQFRLSLFVEALAASLLVQAGTNMVNEYYDYVSGLDTEDSIGIGGVIVHGELPARTVLRGGLWLFAAAIALGLHIGYVVGWEVFVVGLVCIASAYLYTGGPWPLAYTPLGELQVFIFMGLVMVSLGYYIHTGTLTPAMALAAAPVACIVAAILLVNNIRDIEEDRDNGRKTLPVVYGKERAVHLYLGLMAVAYLAPVVGAAVGWFPWFALLPLLTLDQVREIVTTLWRYDADTDLAPTVPQTAALHGVFGLLLTAGFLLGML